MTTMIVSPSPTAPTSSAAASTKATVVPTSRGITKEEWERRDRRKLSYHLLGTKNHLPKDDNEFDEDPLFQYLISSSSLAGDGKNNKQQNRQLSSQIKQKKSQFLRTLGHANEDISDPKVQEALDNLCSLWDSSMFDARKQPTSNAVTTTALEGMWISLIKPKFMDDLGMNNQHEYLYSLKRLSFGKLGFD